MAEFYLVRHGQASFGSDNYDQLSDMGYQQALWLGEHFSQQGVEFDRVITGGMMRHEQTAHNICQGLQLDLPTDVHEGLNEFDFYALVQSYFNMFPDRQPTGDRSPTKFFKVLKEALLLWSKGELQGDFPESFLQFKDRVSDALAYIKDSQSKRTLVVSSGGPISMAMCHILELHNEKMIQINMQIKNSSYSQFFYKNNTTSMASFNATSHLEKPNRDGSITFG